MWQEDGQYFFKTGTGKITTFVPRKMVFCREPLFCQQVRILNESLAASCRFRGSTLLPYLPLVSFATFFALYTCQRYWSSLVTRAGSRSAGTSRPTIKGRWPENLVSAVNGMCIQNSVWWDWSARIYRAQQHDESKARSKKLRIVLCLSENFCLLVTSDSIPVSCYV